MANTFEKSKRQCLIQGKSEFFQLYKERCKRNKKKHLPRRTFNKLFSVMAEVCFAELVVEGQVQFFQGVGKEKINKIPPELQRLSATGRYIDKPLSLKTKSIVYRMNDHTAGNVYAFKYYPAHTYQHPLLLCWTARPVEKLRIFFKDYLNSCNNIGNLPYTLPEEKQKSTK